METVEKLRTVFFIDGYNLYHGVDKLNEDHLKWLDLRELCQIFAPSGSHDIKDVLFFSAHPKWRKEEYHNHMKYVEALKSVGVTTILGKFKEKEGHCHSCESTWVAHEEKETDVNIALHILKGAFQNEYDKAVIISSDSDLSPAVRMVTEIFPEKQFNIVTPVSQNHCLALMNAAGGSATYMEKIHIERSLLPQFLTGSRGETITRPYIYNPPEIEYSQRMRM